MKVSLGVAVEEDSQVVTIRYSSRLLEGTDARSLIRQLSEYLDHLEAQPDTMSPIELVIHPASFALCVRYRKRKSAEDVLAELRDALSVSGIDLSMTFVSAVEEPAQPGT